MGAITCGSTSWCPVYDVATCKAGGGAAAPPAATCGTRLGAGRTGRRAAPSRPGCPSTCRPPEPATRTSARSAPPPVRTARRRTKACCVAPRRTALHRDTLRESVCKRARASLSISRLLATPDPCPRTLLQRAACCNNPQHAARAGSYALGVFGGTACSGGAPITSEAACKAAAATLNLGPYDASSSDPGAPRGCIHGSYVRLNTDTAAGLNAQSYVKPICSRARTPQMHATVRVHTSTRVYVHMSAHP